MSAECNRHCTFWIQQFFQQPPGSGVSGSISLRLAQILDLEREDPCASGPVRFMPLQPSILQVWAWKLRALRMCWCKSSIELMRCCGVPSRRFLLGPAAIWQYPLQIFGGDLHSIYVAMINERPVGAAHRVEPFTPAAPAYDPPEGAEPALAPVAAEMEVAPHQPRAPAMDLWDIEAAGSR